MDDLDRQLWEIDENLCRADLTALQRAQHTVKRKEVWMQREAMKTREAELGGSGGATQIDSRGQKKSPQQQKKFAADTAKKTSQSKASTNKAIARNEKIAPDVQKQIAGTDIEDSGVQLDALAKVSPDEQRKAVKAVNLGHAEDVRDVLPGADERN